MLDLVRQEIVKSTETLVVKIGSNVLAHKQGGLDRPHIAHLAHQLLEWRACGKNVVLVSSGAIAAGLGQLGLKKRPDTLPELQAAAAVGQNDLMQAYNEALRAQGCPVAQILLTAEDFDDRKRYLNVRNTILQLFRYKAIPIINENDTVSVAEIKFGDNDSLAAMVANLLRAQLLVILSIVDGVYPGDIRLMPELRPLDTILDVNEQIRGLIQPDRSGLGTGGMDSKLESARMATTAGVSVWIAGGRQPHVLSRILQGETLGTLLPARGESLACWKRWIGYTARPRGVYVVDAGARVALCEKGRSLLPVGVKEIRGEFEPGDIVAIVDDGNTPFARGLTNYSSLEATRIKGQPTAKLGELLPGCRYDEIIHRDNLVIL